MPLIQGGPPQWIWERTADFLKSEVVPVPSQGRRVNVQANCWVALGLVKVPALRSSTD